MQTTDQTDSDHPDDQAKTFQFSFSFGAKPEEIERAIEAARAAGEEPQIKQYVWKLNMPWMSDRPSQSDPLRTLRRIVAWAPTVVFLAAVTGGVTLGFVEPTLGPIWGGIFGTVLGAITAEMICPWGWLKS
jgi:hypothetical protein